MCEALLLHNKSDTVFCSVYLFSKVLGINKVFHGTKAVVSFKQSGSLSASLHPNIHHYSHYCQYYGVTRVYSHPSSSVKLYLGQRCFELNANLLTIAVMSMFIC